MPFKKITFWIFYLVTLGINKKDLNEFPADIPPYRRITYKLRDQFKDGNKIYSLFIDKQIIIDAVELVFNSKRLSKKKLKTNNYSLFKHIIDFF